jgi:hypothetical protein
MTDKIITINKPKDFQKVKKSIESWIDANVDFYVYAWIYSKEIIDGENLLVEKEFSILSIRKLKII